jgi:MFS family permease
VAAFVLAALFVPESRAAKPRRIDPVGQLLVLLTLTSLTYGIIEGPAAGWNSPQTVGCFALSAAALAALLVYEPRRDEPLLDLRFFRSVPFSGATLIAVCAFGALGGFLFLNTLYLQDVRGLSALHAGLYTLPMAAMTAVVAPLSGRFVGARGPRLPLILAGGVITVATLPLTRVTDTTPIWLLLTCYLVFGIGFGLVNAPITNTAVSGMPREQAGVAAAIASTSRQVGSSLGIAVIGAAVVSGLDDGRFALASRTGWWIVGGCGLAVLALGLLTTGARARATAPNLNS